MLSELKDKLIVRLKTSRVAPVVFNMAGRLAGTAAKASTRLKPLDRKFHVADRLNGPWVLESNQGPHLWLHGASLGECKMLLNLARFLKQDLKNCPRILLTTQKVEVLPYLEDAGKGLVEVALAPADVPAAMSNFMRNVRPVALILAENELWPGYLSIMSRTAVRPSVALVSGRYRRSLPGMDFASVGFACMQTGGDRERLMDMVDRKSFAPVVGGDWKLLPWAKEGSDDTASGSPAKKDVDVAFLSVHFEEWEPLIDILRYCRLRERSVVLMPRRLEEVELFRHELKSINAKVLDWPEVRPGAVALINQFGLTSQVLERSSLAVVGGSFCARPGIHDFWEPLRALVPTCVGPYANGHEDAVNELVCKGVVAQVQSASDFENLDLPAEDRIRECLDSEKTKILNSYQQLLVFLEDLLK